MSDIPRSFSLDPEEEEHANDKWPGPSKTWTTREQWRWLKETRTPYLAAQRGKKLAAYLEEMHREYFVLWPECKLLYGHNDRARLTAEENDALNDAVKKRKEVCMDRTLDCRGIDVFMPRVATAELAQESRS